MFYHWNLCGQACEVPCCWSIMVIFNHVGHVLQGSSRVSLLCSFLFIFLFILHFCGLWKTLYKELFCKKTIFFTIVKHSCLFVEFWHVISSYAVYFILKPLQNKNDSWEFIWFTWPNPHEPLGIKGWPTMDQRIFILFVSCQMSQQLIWCFC